MKLLKKENHYWIIQLEEYILMMHEVSRDDIGYSEVCVGELINEGKGWEVWIAESFQGDDCSQKKIATVDSQLVALELLWEQRNLMNWGYYQ